MSEDKTKSYVKEYKAGEIIFCEYEPGETFYMLKKGKVRISKITEKHEKALDVLTEGSIFGEMAIIESAPRSATVIAETDVVVTEFTRENFKDILSGHPELLVNLIRILCVRIFEAKRRLSIMQLKDNEGRVIDTILMLAENVARKNPDILEEKYIPLITSIANIGHWCGLEEKETKSIIFNLEKSNKVETKPGMLLLKNIQDLKRTIERKKKMAKSGLLE